MSTKQSLVHCLLLASFMLVSTISYSQQGYPPPCQEATQVTLAADSVKRKILFDFIRKCGQENEWTHNKGILHLYQYYNHKNNLCWRIFPTIEDSYKDNPPMQFSDFEGDIVLVYEADSTGRPKRATGDIQAINACLEQIIGDRVYIRPTTKTRWTSALVPYTNRPRYRGNARERTGGLEIIVEFLPDKTYTISRLG